MKRLVIAAAVLAMAASVAGASWAQDNPPPPPADGGGHGGGFGKVREACAADMAKLCPNVERAGRRQCMQDNAAQLSDGCKSAIATMRAARRAGEGGHGGDGGGAPGGN
jgi:Spy/CpxP family protein refolding chaperone